MKDKSNDTAITKAMDFVNLIDSAQNTQVTQTDDNEEDEDVTEEEINEK